MILNNSYFKNVSPFKIIKKICASNFDKSNSNPRHESEKTFKKNQVSSHDSKKKLTIIGSEALLAPHTMPYTDLNTGATIDPTKLSPNHQIVYVPLYPHYTPLNHIFIGYIYPVKSPFWLAFSYDYEV